jgi:hypothetical protein
MGTKYGRNRVTRLKNISKMIKSQGLRRFVSSHLTSAIFRQGFSLFETFGIHVLPVHFYSPVPDTRYLRRAREKWYRPSELVGIDMAFERQQEVLHRLQEFKGEYDNLHGRLAAPLLAVGEGYGDIESLVLYAMVRSMKPKRILEVGAGVSTLYSLAALKENSRRDGKEGGICCIEPYPFSGLTLLSSEPKIGIMRKFAQEVPLAEFAGLDRGDILFIDSSHVAKVGSEVNYLYLEVLPRLKAGVLIHIHDIPFPYPTPEPETWIFREHQFWNEAALVQALLCGNSLFEVVLCTSWMHHLHPELLKSAFQCYDPSLHVPSSLWLRRTEVEINS